MLLPNTVQNNWGKLKKVVFTKHQSYQNRSYVFGVIQTR